MRNKKVSLFFTTAIFSVLLLPVQSVLLRATPVKTFSSLAMAWPTTLKGKRNPLALHSVALVLKWREDDDREWRRQRFWRSQPVLHFECEQ